MVHQYREAGVIWENCDCGLQVNSLFLSFITSPASLITTVLLLQTFYHFNFEWTEADVAENQISWFTFPSVIFETYPWLLWLCEYPFRPLRFPKKTFFWLLVLYFSILSSRAVYFVVCDESPLPRCSSFPQPFEFNFLHSFQFYCRILGMIFAFSLILTISLLFFLNFVSVSLTKNKTRSLITTKCFTGNRN